MKDRQLGSEEFSSPRSGNRSHELPEDYDSPFQERIQRGNRSCCSQELNWFVTESSIMDCLLEQAWIVLQMLFSRILYVLKKMVDSAMCFTMDW